MLTYSPPARDIAFVLKDLLELEGYSALPAFSAVDGALVETIIDEAGRFCTEVIAPLNQVGDREGCTRSADGSVTTPRGYREAYAQFVDTGWGGLALPEEFGGQGMPHVLATVVEELFNSSCQAFHMYFGLTHGAVAALLSHGSEALQAAYLPQLVSGEWLGTMALTEGHCGTDLGLIRTRAKPSGDPCGDGAYAITGEKIFCSGGEHDLTSNIVHLVLARLPDAPAGTRGISLFLVPKFLSAPDGSLGVHNLVTCGSVEEKMGLHGSATCTMNFDGATGWLVGEENSGLAAMFVMMNAARLSCANQSLAQAELAYQNAVTYVRERQQGKAPGERADPAAPADPIIVHPDVRRMLMDARAFTEGFRALLLWAALQIDIAYQAESETERREADELVSLLTPVMKGYGTDRGFEIAVAMQQIFGGHGYIAETGMEQIVRDARAPMLYEGANGVQALDLVGRKLLRDSGIIAEKFFALVEQDCAKSPGFIGEPMADALRQARAAATWLVENRAQDPANSGAGSYAFMHLIGRLASGWMWARMATIATEKEDDPFNSAKLITARYYAEQILPDCAGLSRKVMAGAASVMALEPDQFAR